MNIDFGSASVRRMPVYLLIEVSTALSGAPIQALEQGIQQLHNELLGQSQAIEMVQMAVITFATTAWQIVPLVPITDFAPPTLIAGGSTSLGAGLRLLGEALAREILPSTMQMKGDYRPLTLLLTASPPTDDWRAGLADLKRLGGSKLGTIVALGCGDEVDIHVLHQIADQVLRMADITSDNFRSFFRWVSQPVCESRVNNNHFPASQTARSKEDLSMNIDFGSSDVRRMPVYLLLDASGSMAGAPIQAVEQGVQQLHNELLGQPQAVEMVHVGVITFASTANQIVPLTSITNFSPPALSAGGVTALGGALRVLGQALDREVTPSTAERKGDYKPLVFLLTDGEPTDDWEPELNSLKARREKKAGNIIALGCGDAVNTDVLRQITDQVLLMPDVTSDNLRAFFRWVSASVTTASQSAATPSGGAGGAAALPPPPAGFQVVL